MLQDRTRIEPLLDWQSAVRQADTWAEVSQLAHLFAQEQLPGATAVLTTTAIPSATLPLPLPHTDYWLNLSRSEPFLDSERALTETAVALLSTAPFFHAPDKNSRLRFLETIFGVAEAVRALGPLQPTLDNVFQQLLAAFPTSSAFIAVRQAGEEQITYPCATSPQPRPTIPALHPDSLAAWVMMNGLAYTTGNWQQDDKPVVGLPVERLDGSVMCVPMFYGDDVLGAVCLQNEVLHAFRDEDYEILHTVASYVATAVYNSRLHQRAKNLLERSTRDYQIAIALRQAISIISSTLEQSAVLKNLLVTLDSLLTFDTAYLFLWDNDQWQFAAAHDAWQRPLAHSGSELESIWRPSALLQQIRQEKESIVLNNPAADGRWQPYKGSDRVNSWLGAPLVAGGEVLGALVVESQQPNVFGKQQQWLASTLTAHTAVALQNAQLYRKTEQQLNELSTLYQASATMSANLDQKFVLQSVVSEMVRALQVDSCTIFVWDQGHQHLIPAAHSYRNQPAAASATETPPIGLSQVNHLETNQIICHVFETKEIYSLRADNAYTADRRALLTAAGLQSILLVPLVRSDNVLGLLALGQESERRFFTDNERRLAHNLAGQAAIAIEHAHLFSQAQRRVEELSTFHNIVLQLNTPLKQSTVLDAITESALKLVDATNLHIYLYDPQTQEFSFGSALWRDGRRESAVTNVRENGLTATVIRQARPIIINNATEHPLFQTADTKVWGIQAIAGFPLKRGEEVIGAFTITYLHPHTFTDDEILLLNLLADQAAVAVRNARLFAESQRRLRDMSALVDMAQRITGKLQIRAVLQTTVQILQGLLNARASTITMLANERSELVVAASIGVKAEYAETRMDIEESISGQVLKSGQLIYIQDSYAEPEFIFFSEIVRSLLVVPLIVRGETIGTLTIDSDRPYAFTDSDIQLMTIAAAQVSIAISNAGLFEEVEARASELAVAYEELKESDRLKDELVQNVSHELRTPLTFVKGYVDLLMDGEMGLVTPQQQDALQIVAVKTDEITRLIDDIITLQRIDAGNLQLAYHSLAEMIQTAVTNHRLVAEKKGLTVHCYIPAQDSPIMIDKGRINQVLDNLIANALKFSPDGGTITVVMQEETEQIRVVVSDQGIGMPKEKQSRIFDRFYQIDGSSRRRFGGTGIGLAIVKRIVDAHQGKIWVESEMNQGSSFFFTLPKHLRQELGEEQT